MKRFKRKLFFLPAAILPALTTMGNAAMVASVPMMGIQMKQASDAEKQNQEMMEKSEEQNRELTRALNRIAKNAGNNPEVAKQVTQVMGQKQFASVNLSNLKALGKDLKSVLWTPKTKRFIGTGLASGAAMTATGYAIDKGIQKDMKNIGVPLNNQQEQRSYSVLSNISKFGKNAYNGLKKNVNLKEVGTWSAFATFPAIGYVAGERQQLKNQIAASKNAQVEQQKSYAIPGMSFIKGIGADIKAGYKTFKAHKGQTILGGINKLASYGNIGRREVAAFGQKLADTGAKSGSVLSQKVGNFITNNPKTALAMTIPVSAGVAAGTYGVGEKLTRKGLEKVDKNAFAYEKSKNQQIE